MKIAVAGKGGVGKTTIAATLARLLARDGYSVIAVDVDPSLNLATALGIPEEDARKITPLSQNLELVRSRVGTSFGPLLNLSPRVDDIVERYGVLGPDGVVLLVMGTVRAGGAGCLCPENALIRAMLSHLILGREEVVVLDMAAGLEHLGRGTARGVDVMLCIVEPGSRAIEVASRISELARQIEVGEVAAVANKISREEEREFVERELVRAKIPLLATIPFDRAVQEADMADRALLDYAPDCRAVSAIKALERELVRRYMD